MEYFLFNNFIIYYCREIRNAQKRLRFQNNTILNYTNNLIQNEMKTRKGSVHMDYLDFLDSVGQNAGASKFCIQKLTFQIHRY